MVSNFDIRQGEVSTCAAISPGLLLRRDQGSQFVGHDYHKETRFLGIESSPSLVRNPEGQGVIERLFHTLEEQLLWLREFEDEGELREALYAFRERCNANWILQRHGYRTPVPVRGEWTRKLKKAS